MTWGWWGIVEVGVLRSVFPLPDTGDLRDPFAGKGLGCVKSPLCEGSRVSTLEVPGPGTPLEGRRDPVPIRVHDSVGGPGVVGVLLDRVTPSRWVLQTGDQGRRRTWKESLGGSWELLYRDCGQGVRWGVGRGLQNNRDPQSPRSGMGGAVAEYGRVRPQKGCLPGRDLGGLDGPTDRDGRDCRGRRTR